MRHSETRRTEEWQSHDQEREKHGQGKFSYVRPQDKDHGALRLLEKNKESRGENQHGQGTYAQEEENGGSRQRMQHPRGWAGPESEPPGRGWICWHPAFLSSWGRSATYICLLQLHNNKFCVCDACAHTYTCMLTCTHGSRGSTSVLFHPLLRGRFIDLELSMQSRLDEQWAPGSSLLLTAHTDMTIAHSIPRPLTRLRASCKNYINWAISP